MTETKCNPYEIRENWLELQKVHRLFNFNLTGASHSGFSNGGNKDSHDVEIQGAMPKMQEIPENRLII